jgi:hypothetical protein
MQAIIDTVRKISEFYNISCSVEQIEFSNYKDISKSARGVYILTDGKHTVYVGKGKIASRQVTHWVKANNLIKSYTIDPKGWKWLRENYECKPDTWTLYYINLKRETELSAMEGGLIHMLQPLANDETFKDEERTIRGEKANAN